MALLTPSADYTDKDFDSLRARMRSLIESVFPTWTNHAVANFGNLLVELYAFVGDVLGFYQDNQAVESRIITATQRKNLIALSKLVGYKPKSPSAATATVQFTLAAPVPPTRTVTFNVPGPPAPATNPTTVKTQDAENPIECQLVATVIIPAGASTGTGTVKNSVKQENETSTSTNLPNQEVVLENTPYLDASAVVSDGGGGFTEVENFLQSGPADKHFVVLVDANDRATLRFGDGVNGAIPSGTITRSYETGGGSAGNVETNSLTKIDGSFVDSTGAPVSVMVTNTSAAGGGTDRETEASIRARAPESIRAINRTVAKEDFEINSKLVTGVARALMLTSNEDTAIPVNTGRLYIVPTATNSPPGFPSIVLKDAVLRKIRDDLPHTITFQPSVLSALYVDIGLSATLFLKPGYVAATVRNNILAALKTFFQLLDSDGVVNPTIDFGQNLQAASGTPAGVVALSDLYNVVRDVAGVRAIGTAANDFRLFAERVNEANDSYATGGGGTPAVVVLAPAYANVPIQQAEFPRLKTKILAGVYDPDVALVIDGVSFPA